MCVLSESSSYMCVLSIIKWLHVLCWSQVELYICVLSIAKRLPECIVHSQTATCVSCR